MPSTSHTIQRDTAPSVGRHAPVPGMPLARLEGQIAIGTVLQRFPETSLIVTPRSLQLAPGAIPVRTAEADARPLSGPIQKFVEAQ
jgi:hypothetical protein